MPRSSGRGGNGRDRGEGDTGRSREEENTERSREEKDEAADGFKTEQPPEGDRPDVSVSSGDLSISGDVYKNTGDGASEPEFLTSAVRCRLKETISPFNCKASRQQVH